MLQAELVLQAHSALVMEKSFMQCAQITMYFLINPSFLLVLIHIEWTSIFSCFFHTHNTHNRRDTQANLLRPKICILLVDIYFHPCGWLTLAWQGQISDRRAAIHLMSPCWFGQTSSGKQSLQQG